MIRVPCPRPDVDCLLPLSFVQWAVDAEAAADLALQEAVVAESDAAEAAAEESAAAAEAAELTELEGLVGLEELERLEPPAHHPAAVGSVAA